MGVLEAATDSRLIVEAISVEPTKSVKSTVKFSIAGHLLPLSHRRAKIRGDERKGPNRPVTYAA